MSGRLNRHLGKLAFAALIGAGFWFWIASGGLSLSESGRAPRKANLEVRIKDHREAIADFAKLEVAIDTIRIHPKTGLKLWQIGWKELKPSQEKVDLTKYTGTRSASVFRGEGVEGSFDAVDLKLKEIEAILKKTGRKVAVKNLLTPIQLAFSIDQKNETQIILDLVVLDMSDHLPRSYELHLRGYELYKNGKLVERIPPA